METINNTYSFSKNDIMAYKIFFWLALIFITSCGFRLHGTNRQVDDDTLWETTYITDNNAARLKNKLISLLPKKSAEAKEDAKYILSLSSEELKKTSLSVNPRTGKTEEYQITFNVSFSVEDSKGEPIRSETNIQTNETFYFNEAQALGEFNEEVRIHENLIQEATRQIIQIMQTVIKNN